MTSSGLSSVRSLALIWLKLCERIRVEQPLSTPAKTAFIFIMLLWSLNLSLLVLLHHHFGEGSLVAILIHCYREWEIYRLKDFESLSSPGSNPRSPRLGFSCGLMAGFDLRRGG